MNISVTVRWLRNLDPVTTMDTDSLMVTQSGYYCCQISNSELGISYFCTTVLNTSAGECSYLTTSSNETNIVWYPLKFERLVVWHTCSWISFFPENIFRGTVRLSFDYLESLIKVGMELKVCTHLILYVQTPTSNIPAYPVIP